MRYLFLLLIALLGFIVFMAVLMVFGTTGLRILLCSSVAIGFPWSIWYARHQYRLERSRAVAHMDGRPALDPKQFGQTYFGQDHAETAARLKNVLAAHIPLDISKLHPDDKLVDDLRMDVLDSLSTQEFIMQVEEEFGVTIPNSEAGNMRTFKDVFDYVVLHGHPNTTDT